MPAMLGCSSTCPNCKHQFSCCPPQCCVAITTTTTTTRRNLHALTGGGLVAFPSSTAAGGPQMSPSSPLAFVLPPSPTAVTPPIPQGPEADLARLASTVRALRLSGWYYEGCSHTRSDELLRNANVGTFLVRDSSDPQYLFALSVRTPLGPRSVRLQYAHGHFRLDAQVRDQESMPLFPGVVELVQHYVNRVPRKKDPVFIHPEGHASDIRLFRPLRKEGRPPSLQHLARLAVNKAMGGKGRGLDGLGLPKVLTAYVAEYPYTL